MSASNEELARRAADPTSGWETLQQIAKTTDAQAVAADDIASLDDAYKKVGSVIGYETVRKPITATYAAVALGFAVVAALGAVFMAARWPR